MSSTQKKRILLVDDDESFLKAMGETLTDEGYEVYLAKDGYESLDLAKSMPFDLTIIDVRMPNMDGIDSLSEIKRIQPSLRSIIITGYASYDSLERAERIGTNSFFYKPFDIEAFLQTIKKLLATIEETKRLELKVSHDKDQYLELAKALLFALLVNDKIAGERVIIRNSIIKKLANHYQLPFHEQQVLELAGYLMEFPVLVDEAYGFSTDRGSEIQLLHIRDLLKKKPFLKSAVSILHFQNKQLTANQEKTPFLADLLAVANAYAKTAMEEEGTKSPKESLRIVGDKTHTHYNPDILQALCDLEENPPDHAVVVPQKKQGILKTTREQIVSLLALGNLYRDIHNFPLALEAYKEALTLLSKLPSERILAASLLGMAKCHLSTGNIIDSFSSARNALEVCAHSQSNPIKFQALLVLGECCIANNTYELACDFFGQAKETLKQLKSQEESGRFWLKQAWLHIVLGEKPRALTSFRECLSTLSTLDNLLLLFEEKDTFANVVAAFFDQKEELQKLLKLSHKLEERAFGFINAVMSKLSDVQRIHLTPLIKEEFPVPINYERLRVFTLGAVCVYTGGKLIEEQEWKLKKPKYFLVFLLVNKSKHLTDDLLMDAFWPNMPPEKARNNLHNTVHNLRRILEPHKKNLSNSLYICRKGSCYYFNPDVSYWWDVNEFEEAIAKGEKLLQEKDITGAVKSFKLVELLYQGDFLIENLEDEWALLFRDRLHQKFCLGMLRLAKCLLEKKDLEDAALYSRRVIEEDPYNEDAYAVMIESLIEMKQHREAMQYYKKYATVQEQELKLLPSEKMGKLYQKIVEMRYT